MLRASAVLWGITLLLMGHSSIHAQSAAKVAWRYNIDWTSSIIPGNDYDAFGDGYIKIHLIPHSNGSVFIVRTVPFGDAAPSTIVVELVAGSPGANLSLQVPTFGTSFEVEDVANDFYWTTSVGQPESDSLFLDVSTPPITITSNPTILQVSCTIAWSVAHTIPESKVVRDFGLNTQTFLSIPMSVGSCGSETIVIMTEAPSANGPFFQGENSTVNDYILHCFDTGIPGGSPVLIDSVGTDVEILLST